MRNLLALIGLVVVGFAGAGWYLGWYKLGIDASDPNHPKVNAEIESDKIKQDWKSGEKKVEGFVERQVQGQPTSRPVTPSELPPLPPPPPPPANFNPNVPVSPVQVPPPPSFIPNK